MDIKEVLKRIIKTYLNDEKLTILTFDEKELFKLANTLNVSSVVAYTLKKMGYKSNLIEGELYKSIGNFERINSIKESISKLFDKNNINYLFLKGSSISKYYKESYLRYSADLDIIIKKEDYDKAYNLLISDLSFSCVQNAIHEATLANSQGICVDFHKSFLYDMPEFEDVFINSFNNSHELNDDDKYLYHLAHGAVHLVRGQLELRFFIDLYYLRKNINKDAINNRIQQLELSKFEEVSNSYLGCLLGYKDYSNQDKVLEEYIFNYSKDLGASNRVSNNSNKLSYFIHHIFPSYEIMKGKYPVLDKFPIFLPIMYIYRIIKILFSNRRKYAFNEIKEGINNKNTGIVKELGLLRYNK